ncbi:MAG: hypothetical protein L0H93_07560 [Nocardioides sp.]|nr:hypothetical protein [Nocardioides sp.]
MGALRHTRFDQAGSALAADPRDPYAVAGLEVVGEIVAVVGNRETVDDRILTGITVEDVQHLYDAFIGPAVDRVEDYLLARENGTERWPSHLLPRRRCSPRTPSRACVGT